MDAYDEALLVEAGMILSDPPYQPEETEDE